MILKVMLLELFWNLIFVLTKIGWLRWVNVGKPLYRLLIVGNIIMYYMKIRKRHLFLCWLYNVGPTFRST